MVHLVLHKDLNQSKLCFTLPFFLGTTELSLLKSLFNYGREEFLTNNTPGLNVGKKRYKMVLNSVRWNFS